VKVIDRTLSSGIYRHVARAVNATRVIQHR
jgi:hypothetical protein